MDLFEIALILAIALIVIGPERLPEVLQTVGKVLRELRLASNTVLHELTDVMEDPPRKVASTASTPAAKIEPPPPSPPPASPPENT